MIVITTTYEVILPIKEKKFINVKTITKITTLILVILFTSSFIDVRTVNIENINVTLTFLSELHVSMLKIIIFTGIFLLLIVELEREHVTIFTTENESNGRPRISKMRVQVVKVIKWICLYCILVSTLYMYTHLYSTDIINLFT